MKNKCFFILILLIIWVSLNGQTGPVFQYNHPLKQEIKSLAMQDSPKGLAFRSYLLEVVNSNLKDTALSFSREDIPFIFESIYFEEVYLQQGGYMNSGYNPSMKKMVASLGHRWAGFAWVFRIGSFSFPLIKEDCGNILKTEVFRTFIEAKADIEVQKIKPEPQVKRDTIYLKPTINNFFKSEISQEKEVVIPEITKKKSKFWKFVAPIIGASVLATGYLLLNKRNNNDFSRGSSTRTPDGGNPGGAPITPPDGGGPGGSPTTP